MHWTPASRTRQVSTGEHEGDGEPRERLEHCAKRSAPLPGHAGRGSYSSSQTSAGCTREESRDSFARQGLCKIPGRAASHASSFMRLC